MFSLPVSLSSGCKEVNAYHKAYKQFCTENRDRERKEKRRAAGHVVVRVTDDGREVVAASWQKQIGHLEEHGLQWPLDVHGLVAARDSADHNRNFLFNRTKDNCQTLTQEDLYLLLTGPSRAIVMIDPITFEIQLKVKSKTEPEKDELLASTILNRHRTFNSKDVRRTRRPCGPANIALLSLLMHRCFLQLRRLSVSKLWMGHHGRIVSKDVSLPVPPA